MNAPLSPAAKKAYEVGYGVFRIAANLHNKPLADALQQESLHLLWNSIRSSKPEAESGIQALYYLISFGKDTGTLHPENADMIIRQLEIMNFLLESSFASPKEAAPVNLKGVFSEVSMADVETMASYKTAKPKEVVGNNIAVYKETRPEKALGPGQKERQHLIIDKIRQSGNCRTNELQALLPNLSERTLRYDLQRLVEQGKIERGGAGPASWYRIKEASEVERNVSEGISL